MSKEANQYVDLATIRVSDNIAKMQILTNISKNIESIKIGEKGFSMKAQLGQDCKGEKTRLIASVWYSGKIGTGGIGLATNIPTTGWMRVVPGHDSITKIYWKIACGKEVTK